MSVIFTLAAQFFVMNGIVIFQDVIMATGKVDVSWLYFAPQIIFVTLMTMACQQYNAQSRAAAGLSLEWSVKAGEMTRQVIVVFVAILNGPLGFYDQTAKDDHVGPILFGTLLGVVLAMLIAGIDQTIHRSNKADIEHAAKVQAEKGQVAPGSG